mgnify:CR=1 FL=1
MDEKIRLGGMALINGVLVHGPNSWACAIRTPSGELKVESDYKRFRAATVRNPLLRGPARMAEVFALLPQVRHRLPEARLPFQRPQVLAAMLGTALAVRSVKESRRLSPLARELVGSLLSLAPAALAMRGSSSPPTTAPSTSRSGRTSTVSLGRAEHERCGSHMLGPLVASSAVGGGARLARSRAAFAPRRA